MRMLWIGLALSLTLLGQEDKVARGKYLVEEVARCHDCHTPKMDNGSYIKSQWMKGATMTVAPASSVSGWHSAVPDVTPGGALWKRWGDAGMIAFLETGKTPRGGNASPPMPVYTLKHDDAEAIVAFLKTLQ
ncbi:MAG: c-type cytochrome [Acidobacteriota bacterium]|nr:c-type cytochrome [Acidobacteriota bacterium]